VEVTEEAAERDKGERELSNGRKKNQGGGWFMINFEPDFLFHQAKKFTFIYRRWKRDISSLLMSNLGF
jgi:hypothetical protein